MTNSGTSSSKQTTELTLLIDADLYLYRACAASEEETDWGDDIWSLSTDLKVAKRLFSDQITRFKQLFSTDHAILAISDRDNFRKEIEPTYKGGRKKVRKPLGYAEMLDWVSVNYTAHSEPLLEADDVLGILATAPGANAIIISDDKDMKSVPGRLYRPASDEKMKISRDMADWWFYRQTLTGDAVDGYGGCPTVGEKTAEKILGTKPTWTTVVKAYEKQGLSTQDAIKQARLARILRFEDWDADRRLVNLWNPQ
jgi:DNA polymerase I